MRLRLLPLFAWLAIALSARAQTNSVTYSINSGLNAIVNQVNAGSNTLGDVIGYAVPNGTVVYFYSPSMGYYDAATFYTSFGWFDEDDGGASTNGPVLEPGLGAFLFDPTTNFQFTAVGAPVVPTLPLTLTCDTSYFIGRQNVGIGIFENITGLPAQDGDQIFVYEDLGQTNVPASLDTNFSVHTFSGGGWVPNLPYLSTGQPAFIRRSCQSNSCIMVQATNMLVVSSSRIPVSFAPNVFDFCSEGITNPVTVYCRPPSGSIFSPGTTPVHCVAVDSVGQSASADFTVTVAPPPIEAPTNSYTINITSGLNLIAYQYDNGGNTLREIMTNVPNGTVVTKYLNGTGNWLQSTYNAALGAWVPANITLRPGEGAFLNSPTNFPLILTGHEHVPTLPISLTNGIELLSRQTDGEGTYANIVGVPTPPNGTKVFQLNSVGGYSIFTFAGGHWSPSEPSNNVGQAWWISRPGGPSTPPTIPIPPTITQQPFNISTNSGGGGGFFVAASGSTPLFYQWRLNGNPLVGQTNQTLVLSQVEPTNCGTYDVLVENQIGLADSTNVTITLADAQPLPFSDLFTNAGFIFGPEGSGTGSNINATIEPGEPNADFIPGGASVWLQWLPFDDGVVTFTTAGSGFDTLLGVYTGTSLTNLVPVAADDDSAGFLCSSVSFNAQAGAGYFIQVEGFYGFTGSIVLNWNEFLTEEKLPVIVTQPQGQTVANGSQVQFDVAVETNDVVTYQWLRDGHPIAGATNNLYTTNASIGTVGFYQVIVSNLNGDGLFTLSHPADLQVNVPSPGQPVNTGARAESKLLAVMDTTVIPNDPYDPPIVTGYSGVETFSMYDAVSEITEPPDCGVTCFSTKWHKYTAMVNGLLSVSDFGTTFSGVMGVYTGPDFTLLPLACSGGHPAGTEVVAFAAQANTDYWIALSTTDNNPAGMVQLQYSTLAPPFYTLLPVSQSVIPGANLTLSVATTGNPAVGYQWQLDGTNIPNATSANYSITDFAAANQGNYNVIATNTVGTNIFIYAPIYLNSPLEFVNTTNLSQSNVLFSQLISLPNSNYIFATSPDLINWTTNYSGSSSATGIINFTNTFNINTPAQFNKAILPIIN